MSGGTIVCDLDGVVYLGDEAVPGSGDALRALEGSGHRLLFCTNNSSRTRRETAAKIRQVVGYPAAANQVVSSAGAAAHLVARTARRALVVGGTGIREALEEAGIEVVDERGTADLVVVGLDTGLTYRRLAVAAMAVRDGARFVATNHDPTYPTPEGLLPGAGSIVAAIEVASGRTAEVAGKPHRPMRSLIADRVGRGKVWMVGDRPETDLAMAHAEGWSAVLVLTGVTADPTGIKPAPSLVIPTLADLPSALAQ